MKYIREINVKYGKKLQSIPITSPNDIANFIRNKILKTNAKEHFILLCLDGSHHVIGYNVVSIGTANAAMVHPREVFQPAVLTGAVSIVVAHNHPSGSLTPSKEDRSVTEKLKEAGKLLDIKVLDHLIITEESHLSFHEMGMM